MNLSDLDELEAPYQTMSDREISEGTDLNTLEPFQLSENVECEEFELKLPPPFDYQNPLLVSGTEQNSSKSLVEDLSKSLPPGLLAEPKKLVNERLKVTQIRGPDLSRDLDKFRQLLPPEVLQRANQISQQMITPIRKGKPRQYLIFVCLSYAIDDCNFEMLPKQLAEMVGIASTQIETALNKFSEIETGYRHIPLRDRRLEMSEVGNSHTIEVKINQIINYVKQYWGLVLLEEDNLGQAIQFAKEILWKDVKLSRALINGASEHVAASILLFYLDIQGFRIRKSSYTEACKISTTTLNSIRQLVSTIYLSS